MTYSNAFMDMFGLTVPILQAPVGNMASNDLVRAVGRAGGMGSLAFTGMQPQDAVAQIAELNRSRCPYFLNFLLRFGAGCIREAAAARPPAITFSWGQDADLMRDVKRQGVKLGVQIGAPGAVAAAIGAGADFLIMQGLEAGGHVQSSTALAACLARAVTLAGPVPVIAAGGIATGRDIAWALAQGAQGVMIGTRFVATVESRAHAIYKQALVQAGGDDTAMTNCFDLGWPYAMHRVLRNTTLENWEAAGCPAAPDRPGEGDVIATEGTEPLVRYMDMPPSHLAVGDIAAACLYAGTGVGAIDRIECAEALTRRLWRDACAEMGGAA